MQKIVQSNQPFSKKDSGKQTMVKGPRTEWGFLVLKPGEVLGQHKHREVEESFYFMEGKGIMKVNGQEMAASAGDAYRLDPEETHDIINNSAANLRVLFIKIPYLPEDKVSVP
jgi:mannose-6-phosphate isomerase-like protein (cupin superfamily)